MTPVEAVSTARFWTPSASATCAADHRHVVEPGGPGDAFAFPEFATMAQIPSAGTQGRASCTGAAGALLMVNTPAAAAG